MGDNLTKNNKKHVEKNIYLKFKNISELNNFRKGLKEKKNHWMVGQVEKHSIKMGSM